MRTVRNAVQEMERGEVSARELLAESITAIEANDPELNAFVHLDLEGAQRAAASVDEARARGDALGPLAGVPFGVKDLEDCAGMPTTKGSMWFLGGPPAERDDLHVARLRAAGAIPIGKTAAPEFGAWAFTASEALGVTRNPWDPSRTPGGSSGGSSSAVSSGMVPFATASDGGGSIRTPAAFTGLPGLKPGYGRVPTYNVTHLSQNAVNFALATTIDDTALLLDIVAGPSRHDRTCLPAPPGAYVDAIESLDVTGLRVGWSLDFGFARVDPEVAALTEATMRTLVEAAGAVLVDLPIEFDDYIGIYGRIEGADRWVDLPKGLWPERADELDPRIRSGWAAGADMTLPRFATAHTRRRALEHRVADLFDDIDVLLSPMAAIPAFAAEGPMPTEINGQAVHGGMGVIHGMLANLCNLPAISLPAGVTSGGLPVGLQVIAGLHREDVCLRLGRILELAQPWSRLARR